MIRVALISDQHFDVANRFADTVRIHDFIAEDLRHRKVDAICLGGDLFERKSVPEDRNAAGAWLQKLASIAEVVGVYGNHEASGDLDLFNHLETPYPITFYATPTVHRIQAQDSHGEIGIACIPWPRRSSLLASIGVPASHETANQIAIEHLRAILLGLGVQLEKYPHRLFLGHVSLRGAKISLDQPLAPGSDFELGWEDLSLVKAQAYLLGHIHLKQEQSINGAPCFFPGAPRRCNYGESYTKYYAIVTIENGQASVEYIETPAAPMILAEDEWGAVGEGRGWMVGWHGLDPDNCREAEIRLRYSVDVADRDVARIAAQQVRSDLLANGAVSVKIDEVVNATTRARVPEIASAVTLEDQLKAFWKSKSLAIDNGREQRIFGKLHELEERHAL